MTFLNGIRDGWRELFSHPVRTLVTIVGLVCGVASLIAMVGLANGLVADWEADIAEAGGLQKVSMWDERPPLSQRALANASPGKTCRDADALRFNVPAITHVSPEYRLGGYHDSVVRRGGRRSEGVLVYGVQPEMLAINRYKLARGRFVTALDGERARQVVVIGTALVHDLFKPSEDPIGQMVRLEGQPFRIIGLFDHYEFMQGGRNVVADKNQVALIPLGTALKRFAGNNIITWLNFRVDDLNRLPEALTGAENAVRFSHRGVLDFSFFTQEERLSAYQEARQRLQLSIGGVTAISLFVGGIVVMNIMLASARERVRELGVRKALGARRSDIFIQLMAEAFLMSLIAGLVGVAAGVGLTHLLAWLLPDQSPPVLAPFTIALGLASSLVTGLLAGLYPAITAASLDPIDALQYE